jgi:hypothetical protein
MDKYLGVILAALTLIVLGCWNPQSLQVQQNGKASGCPNYLWLALIALVVGIATVYLQNSDVEYY